VLSFYAVGLVTGELLAFQLMFNKVCMFCPPSLFSGVFLFGPFGDVIFGVLWKMNTFNCVKTNLTYDHI